jgi:hypothetical protein
MAAAAVAASAVATDAVLAVTAVPDPRLQAVYLHKHPQQQQLSQG